MEILQKIFVLLFYKSNSGKESWISGYHSQWVTVIIEVIEFDKTVNKIDLFFKTISWLSGSAIER